MVCKRGIEMKQVLLFILVIGIFVFSACGAPTSTESKTTSATENKVMNVDSNLTAANLKPGDIHGKDFVIEQNYISVFVSTVMLDDVSIEGTTVRYKKAQEALDFTPYFAWVCYPQITRNSQATIIFLDDVGGSAQKAGAFTVRGIVRIDTSKALAEFGGTYGTRQNGW
jgi:hypothetical protein